MTAPRPTEEDELERIERLIAPHETGLGRADIEAAYEQQYGSSIAWRTLLRRLKELARQARVRVEGAGKSTRYLPGPALVLDEPPVEEGYVKIGRESARLRALIRQPLIYRKPVGYDPKLLEGYAPGATWYLPQPLRARLHDIGRTPDENQPAGTYARDIFGRLLIDLAWASSQLEGNTYSRLDTQLLFEFGQTAQGKDAEETTMILNHKAAIEMLVDQADLVGFNAYTIRNLHAALAYGLMADPELEGTLRVGQVGITNTVYTPIAIPQKVEEYFALLLEIVAAIPDPFEQAFFVMVHIPYLQPFGDMNKRTSRMAANIPLIKANLCPLSFVGVPRQAYTDGTLVVYEQCRVELLRDVFVAAYERSCEQYKVVRDSVPPPDPVRVQYRGQLRDVVNEIVIAGLAPRPDVVLATARTAGIPPEDEGEFSQTTLGVLASLHEGAIARYGIRPTQFAAWRKAFTAAPTSTRAELRKKS